jgi:hypothetical protein
MIARSLSRFEVEEDDPMDREPAQQLHGLHGRDLGDSGRRGACTHSRYRYICGHQQIHSDRDGTYATTCGVILGTRSVMWLRLDGDNRESIADVGRDLTT